ncbi:hypothetical protein PI126_g18258 [Phytophthora idaei]|nr:hypothetical protein PI126_g18258 [Phytophthora idaei]
MSDSEEHGYEYDSDDQFGSEERGKLGKIYLDIHEFDQLQKLLTQPYEYFQTPDSVQHPSKATALLDGYALEIQAPTAAELCVTTKTSTKMRVIYPKTLDLDAAVADP